MPPSVSDTAVRTWVWVSWARLNQPFLCTSVILCSYSKLGGQGRETLGICGPDSLLHTETNHKGTLFPTWLKVKINAWSCLSRATFSPWHSCIGIHTGKHKNKYNKTLIWITSNVIDLCNRMNSPNPGQQCLGR